MSSAVEEAPLAGRQRVGGGAKSEEKEESALRATTSICSGDWIFGFFFFFLFVLRVAVGDTSARRYQGGVGGKERGADLVSAVRV